MIEASRAYAFRLERGQTPAQAREYLATRFGLTPEAVRSAIYYAQKGLKVAENLQTLRGRQKISTALGGQREPEATVGVRVRVKMFHGRGDATFATVYVNADWDMTVKEIKDKAAQLANKIGSNYEPITSVEAEFIGPTLWGVEPGSRWDI